jgi:hypothetical protein
MDAVSSVAREYGTAGREKHPRLLMFFPMPIRAPARAPVHIRIGIRARARARIGMTSVWHFNPVILVAMRRGSVTNTDSALDQEFLVELHFTPVIPSELKAA